MKRLERVRQLLNRWFRQKPPAPPDPYAGRLVPVRRGPKGRSGAAVAEIEDAADDPQGKPCR